MGILNLTPDSFSDGGSFNSLDAAIAQASRMEGENADILDIGAESTRPGFQPLTVSEELVRLLPVLIAIRQRTALPISVDTYKAATAAAALERGASIINDIWGLQHPQDPSHDMARVVAERGAGVILMHNRQAKNEALDILADMFEFFGHSLEIAAKAGIKSSCIVLDPGIGFGKTQEQNLDALKSVAALKAKFHLPVLVGASRKSFINGIFPSAVTDRLAGTLAAHVFAVQEGADILRVHDVASHAQALTVWHALQISK